MMIHVNSIADALTDTGPLLDLVESDNRLMHHGAFAPLDRDFPQSDDGLERQEVEFGPEDFAARWWPADHFD